MQLFPQPFDANTVKPNEAFEPLPAGWYNGRIVGSEAKPTKDNESGYLLLDIEIIDGEYKNRKVFDRLNLWNKSPAASEIAQRQLSAYCHATGVLILQDSSQLHGIPLKIKLSVRTQEGYDPSNDVKAVKHIQDATSAPIGNSFTAPSRPTMPATPFGQNPALPAQPPAMPAQTQTVPPWGTQAVASPWAQAASAAPTQPMLPPQQQYAPLTQPPMQQPTAGPVPPWRK